MIDKEQVTTPKNGEGDNASYRSEDMAVDDDSEDAVEQELEALNVHLDNLGSALDSIEKKNDDIHAQLVELLEANRQVKMLFRESGSSPDEENKE